jgi:mannitol/fructose-specific phosphotransferase system IIA component (Ntr-type)
LGTPRFSSLLGRGSCWALASAKDKWTAIGEMLDRLVAAGRAPAARRDAIAAAVVEREKSMSTGMERGVALPHAAVEGLGELVTCLAVYRQGVPFQSIDGQPARIVVLILIPKERRLAYLPVLAEAARLLLRDDVRERLLACSTDEDVHRAIAAAEEAAAPPKAG